MFPANKANSKRLRVYYWVIVVLGMIAEHLEATVAWGDASFVLSSLPRATI